jgi:cell wall-associated NlpC family hydrolase
MDVPNASMKKIRYILAAVWCAFILLPPAGLAREAAKNGSLGIVSVPLANVHAEDVPRSRLETQVLLGDVVSVLEKRDNRYRISIPNQDDKEGWVQQAAISIPRDNGGTLNANSQWIVIARPKAEALVLDKSGNHNKVTLYAGTRLPVISADENGYEVRFPDRTTAVVAADEVMTLKAPDPLPDDADPEAVARTARRFQGIRYHAGGLSEQGLDTGGLIYITYRIHGITIGTGLESLKARAERVTKKDLGPGDILVFYGGGEGLFLGNGRFLQVPRKSAVRVFDLNARRYARSLRYGLRIIGADPRGHKRMADMTADEILLAQARIEKLSLGRRIAYWAGRFIGTPYDPDPLGLYVRSKRVVADEKVDCMYHTFRSVELARTETPGDAVNEALALRFVTHGILSDGLVVNYDDRFQYGEDMVFSGKWGKNITADLGAIRSIPGSRGRVSVDILPKSALATRALRKKLRDGDIIYWVKDPKKRSSAEEIVAHLSIVRVKAGRAYVIHASGVKDRKGRPGGGVVKELPLADYVRNTSFIGAFVTRFEQ